MSIGFGAGFGAPFDYVEEAFDPQNAPPVPLAKDEVAILAKLRRQLRRREIRNIMLERRYDATQNTRHMDISTPPQIPNIDVVAGWGGKAVDAIEERIDFRGWMPLSGTDVLGLDEIYTDNEMAVESSNTHIDSLLFGISFATVGRGDPENDEPPILITGESPLLSTLLWDYRARRAIAGYKATLNERSKVVMETLFLPDQTITIDRDPGGGRATVADRDQHNLGRVPMVRFVNRTRGSNPHGRSEITPAIRYYTDAAVRTLLGMETNREFYTVPMMFALNVRPETFGANSNMTQEEKARLGWKIISGHMNLVPPNTEPGDHPPDVKQLVSNPPTPYIEQVLFYAKMICGETGMPLNYLGLPNDVGPVGDAIIQGEYPLVRRAERRISVFNPAWRQLGALAILWRDKEVDFDKYRNIRCGFTDPSTPTRGARADEATKMTSVGILIPDSGVTYDRVGFTPDEQTRLEADKRKAAARALAQSVATAAATAATGANGIQVPPVTQNGNEGAMGAPKNPANVARGTKIATQAGQA